IHFQALPRHSRFSHGYLIETGRFSNSKPMNPRSGYVRMRTFGPSNPFRYLDSTKALWPLSEGEFGRESATRAGHNVAGYAHRRRSRLADVGGTIHRRLPSTVRRRLHPRRFRPVRDPQHGPLERCGDGGPSASHRGRLLPAEPRYECPLCVLVLRAALHADEASGSRALPPRSDAEEGCGIPHHVSRRRVRPPPGGHLDRVLGGPSLGAQRGRRVRRFLDLLVQYQRVLLAPGIPRDDRRHRQPCGGHARPLLRRLDVLEHFDGDAALQRGSVGAPALLRGPVPRIEAGRFAGALPGIRLLRFHRPLPPRPSDIGFDTDNRGRGGRGRISLRPDLPRRAPVLPPAHEAAPTHDGGEEGREGRVESAAAEALPGTFEPEFGLCRTPPSGRPDGSKGRSDGPLALRRRNLGTTLGHRRLCDCHPDLAHPRPGLPHLSGTRLSPRPKRLRSEAAALILRRCCAAGTRMAGGNVVVESFDSEVLKG